MSAPAIEPRAEQRAALATITVSAFALPLMLSSVTVALPAVAGALAMDAVLLSWVPLVFLTSSAAAVLVCGRLADMYGRKRIFTYGTIGVLASSMLVALAQSGEWLIALRALQGVSAAMLYATQVAILSSIYPPERRGQAIGLMAASVYMGLTCGPLLGGWLVELAGWRAAFVAHVPLTLLVLLIGIPRVRGEWAAERRGRFDTAGAVLYAAAIVFLMWGGSVLPRLAGTLAMIAGVLLMWLFLRHERDQTDPLFNVRLFYTNRVFALSSLASLLMYTATFSVLVLASLYLQYLKGLSPTRAGTVMLAQPLLVALVSPLAGRWSDRVEPRILASVGMAITALGLLLLSRIEIATPLPRIAAGLAIVGLGFSLFASPNVNAIMGSVGRTEYGAAGGAVATMRVLGQLCSMGLVAMAFALTIGRVEITPDNYPRLAAAIGVSYLVAAGLCVPGIACSLARGRMR